MPRHKEIAVWKRKKVEVEARIVELERIRSETVSWLERASTKRQDILWRRTEYAEFIQKQKRLNEAIKDTATKLDLAKQELVEINVQIRELQQKQNVLVPLAVVFGIMLLLGLGTLVTDTDSSITGLVVSDETSYATIGLFNDTLDSATVPEKPDFTAIQKTKTVQQIIQETNITVEKDKVKEIKQLGYSAVEVTFEDWKYSKGLIIHKPSINGKEFKDAVPLVEKDEFTYTSTFEDTTIDIKFDQPGLSIFAAGFNKSKIDSGDSWKIAYRYLLPSEDYVNRIRISSSSPIAITDNEIAKMESGKLTVDFAAEKANNYSISTLQAGSQVVYVYLTKNYSADGKAVNDEVILDPTLTIGSGIINIVCGDVQQFDIVNIQAGGTMQICYNNATSPATSGWVNFSLGYFGNFSLDPGGGINGTSATLGGAVATTGNSTQGMNSSGNAGAASSMRNGEGGSGCQDATTADSCGGGGGANGGAGGVGGDSDTVQSQSQGGAVLRPANDTRAFPGGAGGGSNGDTGYRGGAGGAGLKVLAGAGGWIGIRGWINVSGINGTNGDSTDDSGGGGGAGGDVILVAGRLVFGAAQIRANGANGGNGDPAGADSCGGGGGGGGRIVYVYESISQDTGLINTTMFGDGGRDDADCGTRVATDGVAGTVFYNSTNFNNMPITYLVAPANLTTNTTDTTPEFFFNVSDDLIDAQRLNCTLWLQNDPLLGSATPFGNNASVYNGTNTVITANATLSNGPYQWWINCTEGLLYNSGLTNVSEKRNLTINVVASDSAPPNVTTLIPALNSIFNAGTSIEIAVNASDALSTISKVFVNVTYPNASVQRLELLNGTNYATKFNISFAIPLATGPYILNFSANDSLNNLNRTEFSNFTAINAAPVINFVSGVPPQTITEGGFSLIHNITFNVSDANGMGDINNATAQLRINKTEEADRFNTSCTPLTSFGTTISFNCSVSIWYFDGAGNWTINASIRDLAGNYTENRSSSVEIYSTIAMVMSPTAINWSAKLELGTANNTAGNDPLIINNTGNQDIAVGGVRVTGYDLQGTSTITDFIDAGNFTVSVQNGTPSCTGADCFECNAVGGNSTFNQTERIIPAANITAGNNTINSLNGTSGQETLFMCLMLLPTDISRQIYDTSGQHTALWTISIS